MNYEKFASENDNSLFVKSMGKIHHVTHLAFNDQGHKKLFDDKNLIAVALLPLFETQLMANRYGGDTTLKLDDKGVTGQPYTDMYMKVDDGKYFQIAAVFTDVDAANSFMLKWSDTALLDSSTLKGVDEQYHFIASVKKS
jgi:hypothetical protein